MYEGVYHLKRLTCKKCVYFSESIRFHLKCRKLLCAETAMPRSKPAATGDFDPSCSENKNKNVKKIKTDCDYSIMKFRQ